MGSQYCTASCNACLCLYAKERCCRPYTDTYIRAHPARERERVDIRREREREEREQGRKHENKHKEGKKERKKERKKGRKKERKNPTRFALQQYSVELVSSLSISEG